MHFGRLRSSASWPARRLGLGLLLLRACAPRRAPRRFRRRIHHRPRAISQRWLHAHERHRPRGGRGRSTAVARSSTIARLDAALARRAAGRQERRAAAFEGRDGLDHHCGVHFPSRSRKTRPFLGRPRVLRPGASRRAPAPPPHRPDAPASPRFTIPLFSARGRFFSHRPPSLIYIHSFALKNHVKKPPSGSRSPKRTHNPRHTGARAAKKRVHATPDTVAPQAQRWTYNIHIRLACAMTTVLRRTGLEEPSSRDGAGG